MSVQDIEKAISELPRHEFAELSVWCETFQNREWDEQIERDGNVGRFEELRERTFAHFKVGQCRPM